MSLLTESFINQAYVEFRILICIPSLDPIVITTLHYKALSMFNPYDQILCGIMSG